MPNPPKSIVYIRPDTFGDLVIFSSALAELLAAWPNARHTLLVRPGYDALADLFPKPLEWRVTSINPFSQKPGSARAALEELLGQLDELKPDLIVAPTLNRTWLEAAIAHHFPSARRVALGNRAVDELFVNTLRLELGIESSTVFNEIVHVEEHARDWENNHRLVEQLIGRASQRQFPRVSAPAAAVSDAGNILRELELPARGFAAVFAGGLANVPIKAWPYPKFGDTIAWLQRERQLPVLVMGHVSEKAVIDEVVASATHAGGAAPKMWLGRDGEIPRLAGLLAEARFYVGHDTGAMHLAAALDVPTVGIFGGGHWPRFRPVGKKTVSIVQPLPCFGCGWDCRFGDAPCVKWIEPADVERGVDLVLRSEIGTLDEVVEVRRASETTLRVMAVANERYTALQADRLQRQHRIEELKGEANTKDAEIISLKREADSKDAEIATKEDEIDALKAETNGKDEEITDLKRAAEERKREMEAIKAELEDECAQKDTEIAELKVEADTKDTEIDGLKRVCNEREKLIIELDGHIKNLQKIVAHLRSEVSERDDRIAARDAEVARLASMLASLPKDAENWAKIFHDQKVHIGNIEALVQQRERELASAQASIENYVAGYAALEQVKYYSRLLAAKEAVIQNLNDACIEREKVIQQLALDAAAPLGRMHKLWFATKKHVQLKYWAPFNGWLFRKVVEDYWMQIGVLQHYDPRPLAWDHFPKPTLAPEKLPKIGLVTPSYGQATFIESTMLSVLNQQYPKLHYVVQDGGSKDASPEIIARYAGRLHHWESAKDRGQADAIRRGFSHLESTLGPDDVMAWLNSDDFIAPRALRFVAEYFARHPKVDVIYGHRIIIDAEDREVGRWIMPRHDPRTLEWIDYVPQETVFWRKRVWDRVGGIDPSFQFALDWDLLARFQQSNARIVRVPYFLGCFRVHREQKTSQHIHTVGHEEMTKIRSRFHGERHNDFQVINRYARKTRFAGALTARLAAMGIRY